MTTCPSCALAIFFIRAFDLQVSFTPAMPEERARCHQLQRLKRKKVEQDVAVEEPPVHAEEVGQQVDHEPDLQTWSQK